MSEFKPAIPFEKLGKTPRYYQTGAAEKVAQYLKKGFNRILVKGPTGCGKTFTSKMVAISEEIREHLGLVEGEKMRILYIAGKNRLLRQAIEEFNDTSDVVEIVPQSAFSAIPDDVMKKGWTITMIDECHHEPMGSIQKILGDLIQRPIVGLTADDERGDGLLLKFDTVVTAITNRDAAERGFIEKTGINTIVDTGTQDKTEITCDLLKKYNTHMGNSIIFLRTQSEVRKVYRYAKHTLKLDVEFLETGCSEADLDEKLDNLASGKTQFLINCQKVGEGVDTQNVTDVLLMRSFNSAAEMRQYVGRSTRPDSPSTAWELCNPFIDSHNVSEIAGAVKYQRLLSIKDGAWSERMLSGTDHTWGKMGKLRTTINLKALTQSGMEAGVPLDLPGKAADKPAPTTKKAKFDDQQYSLFG